METRHCLRPSDQRKVLEAFSGSWVKRHDDRNPFLDPFEHPKQPL